jgi:hypothetical protein
VILKNCFSKFSRKINIHTVEYSLKIIRRQQYYLLLLFGFALLVSIWFWKRPISGHGGIPVFGTIEIPVQPFYQDDPRWCNDPLGISNDTIGSAGCALSSAAMILHFYGVDLDPQRLNNFLTQHDGYEGTSWIKWDAAALFPPNIAVHCYEDLPSYGLIDCNLLNGNPVIIRIRRPSGKKHFVILVGKKGLDYLVLDPAHKGRTGVYPFYELGLPIEALRFYQKNK